MAYMSHVSYFGMYTLAQSYGIHESCLLLWHVYFSTVSFRSRLCPFQRVYVPFQHVYVLFIVSIFFSTCLCPFDVCRLLYFPQVWSRICSCFVLQRVFFLSHCDSLVEDPLTFDKKFKGEKFKKDLGHACKKACGKHAACR